MLPHNLFEYQQKFSLSDSYICDEYYSVAQIVSLMLQVQHLVLNFLNLTEQLFDPISSDYLYVSPVYIINFTQPH